MSLASQPGLGSTFCFTARFGLTEGPAEQLDDRRKLVAGLVILVVTGSARNREILTDQLSAGGVLVDLAPTAAEALAALRTGTSRPDQYAWAIIDHPLADLSGIELARAIKSFPANADLELLLLAPFDQDISKSADSSFKCLTKPIRQSALWDILASGGAKEVARIPNGARAPVLQCLSAWGARVLLVEDSPVNLEVCVTILESMGCRVETATNGLHAIDRYAGGQFDLIFMDCQMPEMDGYDATAEIRRLEALSHRRTPIIALTGNVIEGARERCLAAGMDDYLAKPFTLDQMRAMLTVWLKSSSPAPKRGLALLPASPPPAELVDFAVLELAPPHAKGWAGGCGATGAPSILRGCGRSFGGLAGRCRQ